MTTRKFYRTTITFEVLSEDPIPERMSLQDIGKYCCHGDWSMSYVSWKEDELNGEIASKELMKQGSDPEFFRLDKDGNDV